MTNQTILITGASSGIGKATAKYFHEKGWNVIATMRSPEKEEELTRLDNVLVTRLDVTDTDSIETAVSEGVERFGNIDALVNNAGRSTRSIVTDASVKDFQNLLEINLLAVVRCTRAAMPSLVRSKGHLINIGSLSAKTASPYMAAYAASKHALAAYTQQWRIEGPPEVHVLLACPGPIRRADMGTRYDQQSANLPAQARQPGGGAKVKTIPPEKLAKSILRACQQRRPELIIPAKARMLFAIAQLWPALGDWILRRWT